MITAGASGFTLIDLLVMLGTLSLLACFIVPTHARNRSSGQGFQCLANTRQLMVANFMYLSENRDQLPMVFHGGYVPTATDVNRPWVTGWLDWGAYTDNTNVLYLTEPRYASLAVYLGKSTNVYKCPADVYVSAIQQTRGWTARTRSISANNYVGKGNAWASGPGYSASGPNNLTIYRGAAKAADLLIPTPAQTLVYIDEHPDSMNDGGFFPPTTATTIPDAPATYHNGAAGATMADGHSEMHRWRGQTMNKPRNKGGLLGVNLNAQNNYMTVAGDPDLYWYSFTSPRRTTRTVAD